MAAPMQTTSFTSPGFDYSADLASIDRRRALSQVLQQQSMQPIDVPQAGAGQFQTRISPFQGAAKMLQAYAGNRNEKKAADQQRALSVKANADLANVLRNAQLASAGTQATPLSEDASGNVTPPQAAVPGDPSKAASIYMQHPQTAGMGQMLMQKEIENQQRQKMLADLVRGPTGNGATPGGPWSPEFAGQSQNPLSGVDPRVLSMILSSDAEMSKLGTSLMSQGNTSGRVNYDQNGQAYIVTNSGQRRDLQGTQQGLNPAERMRIPLEQSRHFYETGQRPMPIGNVPGVPQPQQFSPQAQAPQPQAVPAQMPPSNLPPAKAAEVEASRQKYQQELNTKREFNMGGIGDTLDEAEKILKGERLGPDGTKVQTTKPTASTLGAAYDKAMGFFGSSASGSAEADKMAALGGALVAKMPRMEGPQSDRDVLMYREMAGRIGDNTVPIKNRLEALQTVRELWAKYEGGAQQRAPKAPAARPRAINPQTKQVIEWDGKAWVPVNQ